MMRLAVFADVHGNLPAFDAVLGDMESGGEFDEIWCLGDIAALGGQPQECIDRLAGLQARYGEARCKVIGGNTDRYLVTGERFAFAPPQDAADFPAYRANILSMSAIYEWNMARLSWAGFQALQKLLGKELRLSVAGYGQVIGFHAIPGNDEAMALRPDSADEAAADALLDRAGRLAVGGHTHLAMDRQVGAWRVVNPGSVGLSFGNPGYAEWACLEWRAGELAVELRRVPYDAAGALEEWAARGYPRLDWVRARISSA